MLKAFPATIQGEPLPATEYPDGVDSNVIKVAVIHHDHPVEAERRFVRVPHADDPDAKIGVGSPDGVAAGKQEVYEVIIEGDPSLSNDTYLYVEGGLDIRLPNDVLFRMEGSLIVNGTFGLHAAAELLAWENRQEPWFVGAGGTLYDFAESSSEIDDMTKDVPLFASSGNCSQRKDQNRQIWNISGGTSPHRRGGLHRRRKPSASLRAPRDGLLSGCPDCRCCPQLPVLFFLL